MPDYVLKVAKIVQETPLIKTISFEFPEGQEMDFKAGQFVMLLFPDKNPPYPRAYSIASSPTDKGHIDITFKKEGIFTQRLYSLMEGDSIAMKGSHGHFMFDESINEDIVLIAGGTGLAPLRGIIRYALAKKVQNKFYLILSTKKPEDIIYKSEMKEWNSNGRIKTNITLTGYDGDDWQGHKGRIDKEYIMQCIDNPGNKLFYICGPKAMITSMKQQLAELGVDQRKVLTEIWN